MIVCFGKSRRRTRKGSSSCHPSHSHPLHPSYHPQCPSEPLSPPRKSRLSSKVPQISSGGTWLRSPTVFHALNLDSWKFIHLFMTGSHRYEMRHQCQEILPGLLLGPFQASKSLDLLHALNITHMYDIPRVHQPDLVALICRT